MQKQMDIQQTHTYLNEENKIFYILPQQNTNFFQINPKSIFVKQQIEQDLSTQAVVNALKYRYAVKYLGKQYHEVTILCIPAKQPKINFQLKKQNTPQQTQQISGLRANYLLKVPNNLNINYSCYQGYLSGKRSAILLLNGKLLRYKGCGNLFEGFPVENNELRGCHFYHTAKRQLYMTDKINKILQKQIGTTSGNIPICMFEYNNEQIKQIGLKSDLKLLGKYCCLFQTFGDRRAGTHLISPLEVLFLNFFQIEKIDWMKIFTKNKRIQENEPVQFLPYWLFLEPGQEFLTEYSRLNSQNNYIVLDEVQLKTIEINQKVEFIERILKKFVKNEEQKLFVKSFLCQQLLNFKELISLILEKIGYQMGQIKRIFCDYGINWGYFNDHGNLWHCNAHLNNFISIQPKQNSQFLLPLDYDLAFTRQEYIRIDLDQQGEKKYGTYDKDQFENFLCSQYQSMQMSVSGMEVMNFKYGIQFEEKVKDCPTSPSRMARIVFRDTLIKSFRQGMRKQKERKQEINNKWNKNIKVIKNLIKVCLIISQDFQT